MESITVSEIGNKCKSKTEVYRVLATEASVYLPPISFANKEYIRDILQGKTKYLTCDEVKVIKVPHYEGLTVNKITDWASAKIDLASYLPKYTYKRQHDREWICNLVHTLLEDEFKQFIQAKCKDREKQIFRKKNLDAHILPVFTEVFKKSKSVSTSKGKSHYLSRYPGRDPDVNMEAAEDKANEESKQQIGALTTKLKELESVIDEYQLKEQRSFGDRKKFANLYKMGIINSDGEPSDCREHE